MSVQEQVRRLVRDRVWEKLAPQRDLQHLMGRVWDPVYPLVVDHVWGPVYAQAEPRALEEVNG